MSSESCPHCHGGQTLFDCEICQNRGYIEFDDEEEKEEEGEEEEYEERDDIEDADIKVERKTPEDEVPS